MRNNCSPCYKCERRALGCHSQCEVYQVFVAKNKAYNQKRLEENTKRAIVDTFEHDLRYKRKTTQRRKKR